MSTLVLIRSGRVPCGESEFRYSTHFCFFSEERRNVIDVLSSPVDSDARLHNIRSLRKGLATVVSCYYSVLFTSRTSGAIIEITGTQWKHTSSNSLIVQRIDYCSSLNSNPNIPKSPSSYSIRYSPEGGQLPLSSPATPAIAYDLLTWVFASRVVFLMASA